jgi:hypothetical protein
VDGRLVVIRTENSTSPQRRGASEKGLFKPSCTYKVYIFMKISTCYLLYTKFGRLFQDSGPLAAHMPAHVLSAKALVRLQLVASMLHVKACLSGQAPHLIPLLLHLHRLQWQRVHDILCMYANFQRNLFTLH